jgi:hypothetical protein
MCTIGLMDYPRAPAIAFNAGATETHRHKHRQQRLSRPLKGQTPDAFARRETALSAMFSFYVV